MKTDKGLLIIFIVSLIMFFGSTTLMGMDQEPIKGSTEPQYFHIDITDVKLLTAVISGVTLVCSVILMVNKVENPENR